MIVAPTVEVAVLGGDAREWRLACRLAAEGHTVRTYGVPAPDDDAGPNPRPAQSAEEAVKGAAWVLCPIPGVAKGDVVYAPAAATPIVLNSDLLALSAGSGGGLVLGRATPTIQAAADDQRITVVEMGEEPTIRWRLAVPTSEAVLSVIMEHTDQVLPELRVLILGTGKTAMTLAHMLSALGCRPQVCGRRASELARLEQFCSATAPWEDRVARMGEADVIVNTVPSPDTLPAEAYDTCRGRLVVDTASPPGGLDHAGAEAAGVRVVWARGLAGKRAAVTAGDALFEFVAPLIAGGA